MNVFDDDDDPESAAGKKDCFLESPLMTSWRLLNIEEVRARGETFGRSEGRLIVGGGGSGGGPAVLGVDGVFSPRKRNSHDINQTVLSPPIRPVRNVLDRSRTARHSRLDADCVG